MSSAGRTAWAARTDWLALVSLAPQSQAPAPVTSLVSSAGWPKPKLRLLQAHPHSP